MKQRWLKRSMVLLTVLFVCLFAMATTAYAAEDAIYSEYTVTSTEELGEILRSRLAAREGYFKINYLSPLSPEEFDLRILFDEDVYWQHTGVGNQGDYIKWHNIAFNAQAQYGTVDPETGLYLYTFKYDDIKAYTTAEQEAQVAAKIEALFEEWQIDDMPDYYKVKTIYDYICSHVTYDWDSYWSHDSTLINQYTAHAALIDGTSVCQGYANLFYRMANDAGVDTRLVAGMGDGERHGWNLVCLDGTYYWLDSTWDADIAAGQYRYFLLGSDAFEMDHEAEGDWSAYPISKTDYIHPTAISAEIETAPGRLTYMQGDPLNTDGLTLRITYDDGYTYTAAFGWDISGFDSGVVGVQSISVDYDWTTVTYDVTVAAGPEDWVYHGTNRGLDWTLTPQGLLTISGEGFAKSGVSLAEYPASWHNHREKITSLVIEEGITKIGVETFAFLYNLTSAVIPDSVVQIQDMAFRRCTALADIQIGENVQTIDWDCFSETAYWNDPDNWENGILYLGNYLIGTKDYLIPSDVEIREGTTAIAGHAFYLCDDMETLTIPLSMKEIGLQAFERCDALKTVFYAGSSADWRKMNMGAGNHRLLQGEIVLGNPAYDFIITTDDLLKLSVTAGNQMTVSDEAIAKIVSRYEENIGFYMALQPIQPGELILYENIHYREFVADAGTYVPISFYTVQIVEGNHKLEFVSIEREATCTLPGLEKYACAFCEHEELVETELAKHTWIYYPAVPATCTTDGLTYGFRCSVCLLDDPAQQVIPATGHDYGGLVLVHKPTVTGPAEYRRDCRNCDAFEIHQRFVAEVWIMSQPDQREYLEGEAFDPTGLEVWVHYEDGELQEVTDYAISGYDSTPGAKTITVTCGGKTGTFMVYVNAKEVERIEITTLPGKLTYQEGEAFSTAGMVVTAYYNNGTSGAVTDYTVSGYDSAVGTKKITVSYGGKTDAFQVTVTARIHNYTAVVTPPTCTADGYTTHTCSVCGNSYKDTPVAATGHNMGSWSVTKPATCTEKGSEQRKCANCSHTETREIAAKGHSYKAVVTKPTCTADGYTTHTCSTCGNSYKDTPVTTTGHSMGAWSVTKPATCTEKGSEQRKCANCAHTESREIAAKGHSYKAVVTKPTCTADGYTTHTCSTCGNSYKDTPVTAKGHTYSGENDRTCNTCGATREVDDEVLRVYGSNRFDTAFGAADLLKETLGVDKFDNVIVACGTNFADALAGSYLGKVKNAPILLVQPNVVPTVRAYIEANLKPGGTVYLLGGETIVPGSVSEGLTQFITKRLWGANRYETNLAILEEAGVTGGEILVCTGYGFADSLSASAVGKPILLVDKRLDAKQMEYLSGLKNDSYVIVGGVGAVNETVEAALKGYGKVERLAGANRFTTSVMVAERFFDDPTTAVVAYANNFPDGLCGGPLAAAMGGPLLLTANNDAHITAAYTEANGIRDGVVLGGPGLISDDAVRLVFGMDDSRDILRP